MHFRFEFVIFQTISHWISTIYKECRHSVGGTLNRYNNNNWHFYNASIFFMQKHCSNSPFHCHILYFLHHSYFLLQTQSSISLKCLYFFVCLQAGGSSGLLMDLAANEKDVHADFFNGKKLMSSKCFESLKMRLKVQPDFLFEIYQLVQWFKKKIWAIDPSGLNLS